MSAVLNKWANWKTAEKSLKLEGSQSKVEQKALKPMDISSASKGKPPAEVAVKAVDTTPNIQPPPVTNQQSASSIQPRPAIPAPTAPMAPNSGGVSTSATPNNYDKVAEVRNLINFFNFIKSGVAARSLINVKETDIRH